jgi:2',3'-cyclic-nucleotide 2'-phosphodiesterase (5'-nucleotidase family)
MKSTLSRLNLLISVFLFLGSCNFPQTEKAVEGNLILLDSISAPKDIQFDSIIHIYRASLQQEMNQVMAYSYMAMTKGSPEGYLNNFVADLVFEKGKKLYSPGDGQGIDFCLLNYGGLRAGLPQGAITRSRVFELMPFENEMVVVTLSPEKTWELFGYLAESRVGMPVSGLKLGIRDQDVAEIKIQGKDFDPTREYKVLTSDYLAQGGDNMTFFLEPRDSEILGMRVRDAILKHMEGKHEQGQKIKSKLDGRIYYQD